MDNKKNDYYEIDIFQIISILLNKIWIIILSGFLGGICLFVYSYFMIKPTYQASTLIYVNNNNISIGSTSVSLSSSDISASQSLVDTYIVILKTRNTLETVIERADLDLTYETLNGMITASSVNSTEIFRIVVTSTSPQQASIIANTIARILPDKISEIVTGTSAKVVDYAVTNTKKVAPNITKYTAIGVLIGTFAACALIVLHSILDDTIREDSDVIENYNLPILATIPDLSDSNNDKRHRYYYYSSYGKNDKKVDKKKKNTVKTKITKLIKTINSYTKLLKDKIVELLNKLKGDQK